MGSHGMKEMHMMMKTGMAGMVRNGVAKGKSSKKIRPGVLAVQDRVPQKIHTLAQLALDGAEPIDKMGVLQVSWGKKINMPWKPA